MEAKFNVPKDGHQYFLMLIPSGNKNPYGYVSAVQLWTDPNTEFNYVAITAPADVPKSVNTGLITDKPLLITHVRAKTITDVKTRFLNPDGSIKHTYRVSKIRYFFTRNSETDTEPSMTCDDPLYSSEYTSYDVYDERTKNVLCTQLAKYWKYIRMRKYCIPRK